MAEGCWIVGLWGAGCNMPVGNGRGAIGNDGRMISALTCACGERADDIRPYDKTGVRLDHRVIPTKA